MDDNRISGTTRNLGGKVEEGLGRLSGDVGAQVRGKLDQAAGAAQDMYGQAADATRETVSTVGDWLCSTIETRPYTRHWSPLELNGRWEGGRSLFDNRATVPGSAARNDRTPGFSY